MKTRPTFVLLGFLVSGLFVFPLSASGQAEILDLKLSGEGEVGARGFPDRPSKSDRAKFEEYRDIPSGGYLEDLRLQLESKDETYSLELGAKEPGERDQNIFLRSQKAGRYYFDFEWDQIPHVFSNNGQSLHSGTGGGNLTISGAVRNELQAASAPVDTARIQKAINENVRDIDLRLRQDTAKTEFRYTPTRGWDLRLGYSFRQKNGTRPFGANTGTNNASSFNIVEIPEPIDHKTHDVSASAEYGSDWGSIGLRYTGSIFQDDLASVAWDNPFRTTDSGGPLAANNLGPARGRHALAPDNLAHNVALSGAANLPFRSRLIGTLSYGWWRQDEAFLPMTTNSCFLGSPAPSCTAGAPTASPLPARSLDGKVDTLLGNLTLNTRLHRDVSLTARYRFYMLDNKTPELTFLDYVQADRTLVTTDRRSLALQYNRHNAGLDLGWRPVRKISLKAGYGWERYDRDRRDANVTDEHSGKLSADVTPIEWLLLRASYLFSARRFDKYNHEHFVGEPGFPAGEPPGTLPMHPALRKFDLADRDRNRVEMLGQVTPLDLLTFTATFGLGNDDFKRVRFGITGDDNWNIGADIVYVPIPRVSLFTNYNHEEFDSKMHSVQRPPFEDPNRLWDSKMRDIIDTVGAGTDLELIPKLLDLRLSYGFSTATGKVKTRPLGTGVGLLTPAVNFPDTKTRLHELNARLSYHLSQNVTARLNYIFERWTDKDFATDPVQPYIVAVDPFASRSVFLGATRPNYSVHIIGLSFRFKF
jgi:MtrB/PioB family decaheme-associated outer membrane protein